MVLNPGDGGKGENRVHGTTVAIIALPKAVPMQIVAFLIALAALTLFIVDYTRTKNFIALGLAALVVACMVQLILQSGSPVVAH